MTFYQDFFCFAVVVTTKCFMIGVTVWWVYLAPQNIPRAISVLTLGNKVVLYCMGIKRTYLDEFPPGHPKMFERTLDIISLFVLAISNTINFYFRFVLFPMKTSGKWNYFTQTVQIKKINIDKNNLTSTWHVHKTETFWYPISDVILKRRRERARENSVSNTVWESPLLKSL